MITFLESNETMTESRRLHHQEIFSQCVEDLLMKQWQTGEYYSTKIYMVASVTKIVV